MVAIKLNRNTILLEAFIEYLVHKSITVPLLRDRAYNTKLDTVLEEDNKEKKGDNAAKPKDDTFNTPTALKECINLTTIVEEGEYKLYF